MTDDWTANTNTATELQLVGGPDPGKRFGPTFTYPIFGDAEAVWGYQGLRIALALGATTLRPALHVHWDRKNERAGKTVDNVAETLLPFLPEQPDTLMAQSEESHLGHQSLLAEEQEGRVPPGQKISSFSLPPATQKKGKGKASVGPSMSTSSVPDADYGRYFDIFRCSWSTPGFNRLFLRLRLLTLFFIEGASYFDVDEPGWEFFLLYERMGKDRVHYNFVGFTSLYHFWVFPNQARIRLSQFLILPIYQHQGLGKRLYAAVYNHVMLLSQRAEPFAAAPEVDVKVAELTVEDPSEAFDALRDQGDLLRLLQPAHTAALASPVSQDGGSVPNVPLVTDVKDALHAGKLIPPLDAQWAQATRRRLRLASRQWARLLEMVTFLAVHKDYGDVSVPGAEVVWKQYRLMVKTRLYRKNADLLDQLDELTRRIKLQETYENVVHEYAERLGIEVAEEWMRASLPSVLLPEEAGSQEEDVDGLLPSGEKRTLDWLEAQLGGPDKRPRF